MMEVFGSDVYASLVTGRSSVGRKFVTNHITAGLIDQGFVGTITLEIVVAAVGVVLLAGLGWVITRSVVGPLHRVGAVVAALADGDLRGTTGVHDTNLKSVRAMLPYA